MKKLLYMVRYPAIAALLLLLLAVAPAVAQNVVYLGDQTELGVDSVAGDIYSWELYSDSTVNFATTPGDALPLYAEFVGGNDGATVNVLWKQIGTYFFKVTAWNASGCTSNLQIGMVKVLRRPPTAKLITSPVCEGDPVKLKVELTGEAPWSFTITDGSKFWDYSAVMDTTYEAIILPAPKASTSYWVTVVKDKWGENTKPTVPEIQVVNPKPATSPIYQHEP